MCGNNTRRSMTYSQEKTLDLFFWIIITGTFLSMLLIILYYVYAFAALSNGSREFDWLLGIFSDFVAIMEASLSKNPYEAGGASYPPIAIIILYPFALICKNAFNTYSGYQISINELTSKLVLCVEFWIAFLLFWLLCSVLVALIIIRSFSFNTKQSIRVLVIAFLSSPFIYIAMRGNAIYFSLVFTLLFFFLYKSPNPWIREVGYLFLVLAGAIKIYPLFFGVFLLRERKYWASFRIGIYSVIIFFLSFLLFEKGLGDISSFGENLGGFASDQIRLIETNNLSLSSLLFKLFHFISPDLTLSSKFHLINALLLGIAFAIATISAILSKSDFSRSVICAATIALIPSVSYFYVLSFMIIPFLEFIKDYDRLHRYKQIIYNLFFIFLFFTPFILAQNYTLHSLILIAMLVIEATTALKIKNIRKSPCK